MKEFSIEPRKLGNAIRQARIHAGITQEALAELLGVTPTHVKHIESEHRKPSIEVLFKLIPLIHLSIDALFLPESPNTERNTLIKEIDLMMTKCNEKELSAIAAALQKLTGSDL